MATFTATDDYVGFSDDHPRGSTFTRTIANVPTELLDNPDTDVGATFTITAFGDFSFFDGEWVSISIEGVSLGPYLNDNPDDDAFDHPDDVGDEYGFFDRGAQTATATISKDLWDDIIADGKVEITYTLGPEVDDASQAHGGAQEYLTATITYLVNGPEAADDAADVDEDDTVVGNVILGVPVSEGPPEGQDIDDNGDPLSVVDPGIYTGTYGTLTLHSDGSYTYTADQPGADALAPWETADDVFTYTVTDGTSTDTADLVITVWGVCDPPEAGDDLAAVDEDATVTGNVILGGFEGSGQDFDPEGDQLAIVDVTAGPCCPDGEVVVFFDETTGPCSCDCGCEVFPEVDEGAGPYSPGTVGQPIVGTYGTLTLFADGSYIYVADQPAADALETGQTELDEFCYTVSEGFDSDIATLTFEVTGVEDVPVAADDAADVNEDATASGNVIAGVPGGGQDSHDEGDPLTVVAVSGPNGSGTVGQPIAGTYGTLTLHPDGSYSYTPNFTLVPNGDGSFGYGANPTAQALIAGQSATETFSYTIEDGNGDTDTATLIFTIAGQDEVFFGGNLGNYVFAHVTGGHDQLDGGGGDDHLEGGTGNDRLFGGTGSDSLLGGDGSDHLDGGDGDDRVYGGAGNDSLLGGIGNDRLEGEGGNDLVYGGEGSDGLIGGDGNDRMEGEAGNDTLLGGIGHDGLIGGAGDDILEGGEGNDVLLGEAGTDFLTGGAGDDILDGGAGTDGFIFAPGFGKDIIQNFEGGPGFVDNIRLDPALFGGGPANFAAVLARAADDGAGNVIITFDAATQLSIVGMRKNQLAADDFSFA